MKIIVGLGNPGSEFINTRHNIGFELLERTTQVFEEGESFQQKWEGLISVAYHRGKKLLLLKPQTFMNSSGRSVLAVAKYFKVSTADILVIFDDISLVLGKVRFRKNGSSGGHNGIKSMIEELKSDNFARIKVGVGQNQKMKLNEWVMGKFSEMERKVLFDCEPKIHSILLQWIDGKI